MKAEMVAKYVLVVNLFDGFIQWQPIDTFCTVVYFMFGYVVGHIFLK